ncbi:hypothetical protein Arub01_16880 [Actinomadura rubrobrunea]|uniref:Uncharacterized protein n=1 Tax=Actinomadura rubrobrunea TaxID=115335 RepID=A0A9W6PUR7_9ACTN|nr:hypothetical protein Arub01_16880 [Actinomadura rubrobrunea]
MLVLYRKDDPKHRPHPRLHGRYTTNMSNRLANPRRTRLSAWPKQRTVDVRTDQGAKPAESASPAPEAERADR